MLLNARLRAALETVLKALDRDSMLGRPVRGVMANELREAFAEAATQGLQAEVGVWVNECFNEAIASDTMERNHRFLEEALEVVQANNATAEEAHTLVDYVFARPVGEKRQEAGQALITLAALCQAAGVNLEQAATAELDRIKQPEEMARIREKQKNKPAMSPLPGVYPERRMAAAQEQKNG